MKLSFPTRALPRFLSLAAGIVLLISLYVGYRLYSASKYRATAPVPYTVSEDYMYSWLKIEVPADITEMQLGATLAKAADDHQDDAARDYLGCCLTVEAFLTKDDRRSVIPAGGISRRIPFKNPAERKAIKGNRGRWDIYYMKVDRARESMQPIQH